MQTREATLKQLSKQIDPRNESPEFRIILDTLQEMERCGATELCKEITGRYPCSDGDVIKYDTLYSMLQSLAARNIVTKNIDKTYTINPEYITIKIEVQKLPISNYMVGLFGLSGIFLALSYYLNFYILIAAIVTGTSAAHILAQHLGSEFEFNLNGHKNHKE